MSTRVTEWMATRVTEYASRLTRRSLARQPSAIRALQPLVAQPGMISLGGGMPNPSTFPFTKITASLRDGSEIELGGARLEASLQYSPTLGLPSLRAHLQALQEAEHGVTGRQVCVTTGSADALSKAFDAGKARCFLDQDRQRLLAVIEASFGTFAPFNKLVRGMFEEKVQKARAGA